MSDKWTEQDIIGILLNPVNTGMGPEIPALITDEQYVRAVTKVATSGQLAWPKILVTIIGEVLQTFGTIPPFFLDVEWVGTWRADPVAGLYDMLAKLRQWASEETK